MRSPFPTSGSRCPKVASPTVTAEAGGAQKVYWILLRDGLETPVAVDRFAFTFDAGRVTGDTTAALRFQAVYADSVKTKDIPITIREDIPEPVFTLHAPAAWDGRSTIEVVPQITNLSAMQAKDAGHFEIRVERFGRWRSSKKSRRRN